METVSTISHLLHRAAVLAAKDKAKKAEDLKKGNLFNVFRICKVDHYETLHSAILSEWLNPSGSHGQGHLFLSLFLHCVDEAFALEFKTETANVFTEYSTPEGRLDILIEDHAGKGIIIENKIYAQDEEKQLQRYDSFANSKYKKNRYRLFYLTLYGQDASDESGKGVQYGRISYATTILHWLNDCVRESYDKPLIRESLIQYMNLIKQLTGQDMNNNIENAILEEMLQSPDGVAAILKTYPAWEKAVIEKDLFNPLREFVKEREERELHFGVSDTFWNKNAWVSFWVEIEPKLRIVFQFEKKGWVDLYYGVVDERPNPNARIVLPGLEGGNNLWRYGWHYCDNHRNWTVSDIAEINQDKGNFLNDICRIVDSTLLSLKKAGITA